MQKQRLSAVKLGILAGLFLCTNVAAQGNGSVAQGEATGKGAAVELEVLESKLKREEEMTEAIDKVTTLTAAGLLLGMVGFSIAILYLVNYHDKDIRDLTWQMISSTLSIFIAVHFFNAITGPAIRYLGGIFDPCFIHFAIFIILWFSFQMALYGVIGALPNMISLGTIGGHITGFACMATAKSLFQMPFFKQNAWSALLVVLIFIVGLSSISLLTDYLRREVSLADDGELSEEEQQWEEQCAETEDDVIAICMGFMFCYIVRFAILGEMPKEDLLTLKPTDRPSISNLQLWGFFGVCIGCMAMVGVMTFWDSKLRRVFKRLEVQTGWEGLHEKLQRITRLVSNVFALSMAWCLLFWGDWVASKRGMENYTDVLDYLILALCIGFCTICAVFVLDFFADTFGELEGDQRVVDPKALRAIITALGILVGLSWEDTFDACLEGLAEFNAESSNRALLQAVMNMMLAGLAFPAWKLYILPRANKELQELCTEKYPGCWAICDSSLFQAMVDAKEDMSRMADESGALLQGKLGKVRQTMMRE